jgi:hypothetical protein
MMPNEEIDLTDYRKQNFNQNKTNVNKHDSYSIDENGLTLHFVKNWLIMKCVRKLEWFSSILSLFNGMESFSKYWSNVDYKNLLDQFKTDKLKGLLRCVSDIFLFTIYVIVTLLITTSQVLGYFVSFFLLLIYLMMSFFSDILEFYILEKFKNYLMERFEVTLPNKDDKGSYGPLSNHSLNNESDTDSDDIIIEGQFESGKENHNV